MNDEHRQLPGVRGTGNFYRQWLLAFHAASAQPDNTEERSPEEAAAALEAQRLIDRASGKQRRDSMKEPPRLFSWQSVRIVFTMDGRYPFTRYDDNGNPLGFSASAYVLMAIVICMMTLLALFVRAVLTGDY